MGLPAIRPAGSSDALSGAAPLPRELLSAIVAGQELAIVVPLAVDAVERDPLVRAIEFPGDLLRALMEVPGGFWRRAPALYQRYRAALRAAAAMRRQLPMDERMRFWEPLPPSTGSAPREPDGE
jgi:hypothetical protein